MDDQELERFFEAARNETKSADPDVTARMLVDAYAQQPVAVNAAPITGTQPLWSRSGPWLSRFALPTGLAAAAVAGLWIGAGASDTLLLGAGDLAQSDLALELVYRFPALSGLFGEI